MRRITLLVLTLIISAPLWGQIVMREGVLWTNPTQREDGTTLPANELADTTLHCGIAPGTYTMEMAAGLSGEMSRAEVISALSLQWGTEYFCAMSATDTEGQRSVYSAEANFTVVPAPPAAPTLTIN